MDEMLRAAQRYTKAHPEDGEGWRRYALQLERQTGIGKVVIEDPITVTFKSALLASGFENIHQISQIKTLPQIERLAQLMFPFGCEFIEFMESGRFDDNGNVLDHDPNHDVLMIGTGLYAHREIPLALTQFFDGEGSFELWEPRSEVIWLAPFLSAWTIPEHLKFRIEGGQMDFDAAARNPSFIAERDQSYNNQDIRYYSGK